jgi:hypothetical protein
MDQREHKGRETRRNMARYIKRERDLKARREMWGKFVVGEGKAL